MTVDLKILQLLCRSVRVSHPADTTFHASDVVEHLLILALISARNLCNCPTTRFSRTNGSIRKTVLIMCFSAAWKYSFSSGEHVWELRLFALVPYVEVSRLCHVLNCSLFQHHRMLMEQLLQTLFCTRWSNSSYWHVIKWSYFYTRIR